MLPVGSRAGRVLSPIWRSAAAARWFNRLPAKVPANVNPAGSATSGIFLQVGVHFSEESNHCARRA